MPTTQSPPLYGQHLESLPHPPSTVLLLRTPVSPAEGTDPYHDAFGSFCLPGFEISALESGSSTPINLSPSNALRPLSGLPTSCHQGSHHQASSPPEPEALHDALSNHSKSSGSAHSKTSTSLTSISSSSEKEKRRGRWITDEGLLTTHHLSFSVDPENPDEEEIEREYCVSSIPILSHCTTNLEVLAKKLVYGSGAGSQDCQNADRNADRGGNGEDTNTAGQTLPYRGIIVCSQRAVDAISSSIPLAVEMLCREAPRGESAGNLLQKAGIRNDETGAKKYRELGESGNDGRQQGHRIPLTSWPTTPFFAVGPATQKALSLVTDSLVYSSDQDSRLIRALAPSIILGGAETGNAEALGQFILEHFKELERRSVVSNPSGEASQNGDSSKDAAIHPDSPILLLQGDKSLGTLPKLLSSANPPIRLDIVKCYETCAHEKFSESCHRLSRTLALARKSASRRGSGSGPHQQAAAAAAAAQTSLAQAVGADFAVAAHPDSFASRSRRNSNQSSITAAARAELGRGLTPMPPQGGTNSIPGIGSTFSLNTSGTGSRFSSSDSSALIIPSGSTRSQPRPPRPDWLVFFSPSGVQYALPELRSRGWFPPAAAQPEQGSIESRMVQMVSPAPPEYPRIAVLGPTTKKYLRDELSLAPDAVAAVPGPSELREAIRMAEKRLAKEKKREEARLIWAENRKRSAIAKAREMEMANIEASMIAQVRNPEVNGNGSDGGHHLVQR